MLGGSHEYCALAGMKGMADSGIVEIYTGAVLDIYLVYNLNSI
jgi:hypothetical protein